MHGRNDDGVEKICDRKSGKWDFAMCHEGKTKKEKRNVK